MTSKNHILVMLPVTEKHKQLLQEVSPESIFDFTKPKTIQKEQVDKATIIIGNVSPKLIEGSQNLKWLQLNSAGTDGYLDEGVLPKGAMLTNATGAYGLAISEYMIGTLLLMMKKLDRYLVNQSQCQWKDEGTVSSIYGARILVVGMGDIGSEFAKKVHAMGASVVGVTRNQKECQPFVDKMITLNQIEEEIGQADVVVSSLPGSSSTYQIFNKGMFDKMKKGSFFVNVGRGNAVNTMDLVDALENEHLAGAALDVTDPEPLPEDHPLWKAKNVVITPHVSGFFHLPETFERVVRISVDNLRRFEAGEELQNIVDFQTGYRKL